jgi:hypothetical protein
MSFLRRGKFWAMANKASRNGNRLVARSHLAADSKPLFSKSIARVAKASRPMTEEWKSWQMYLSCLLSYFEEQPNLWRRKHFGIKSPLYSVCLILRLPVERFAQYWPPLGMLIFENHMLQFRFSFFWILWRHGLYRNGLCEPISFNANPRGFNELPCELYGNQFAHQYSPNLHKESKRDIHDEPLTCLISNHSPILRAFAKAVWRARYWDHLTFSWGSTKNSAYFSYYPASNLCSIATSDNASFRSIELDIGSPTFGWTRGFKSSLCRVGWVFNVGDGIETTDRQFKREFD